MCALIPATHARLFSWFGLYWSRLYCEPEVMGVSDCFRDRSSHSVLYPQLYRSAMEAVFFHLHAKVRAKAPQKNNFIDA